MNKNNKRILFEERTVIKVGHTRKQHKSDIYLGYVKMWAIKSFYVINNIVSTRIKYLRFNFKTKTVTISFKLFPT